MERRPARRIAIALATVAIAACSTAPPKREPAPAQPPARTGGYYKDDGPGANPPANLDQIADAVPRAEPLHRFANRPYTVFGREYVPATSLRPYSERGVASWYGRKFHGERTSTGEIYDMYAMTAAHPTLALPSYARVTNVANGRSVVVRVNDRGPFFPGRVIDLSYAAAYRLGISERGSGEVEVQAILPPEVLAAAPLPAVAPTPAPVEPPVVAVSETGYAVQLGAFASYVNAQNFLAHVSPSLVSLGNDAKVRQLNGLFRVYLGPYPTRDEARRTADALRDSLGLASTIAVH